MTAAVGILSSSTFGSVNTVTSQTALEAQLAQYKKQLADCIGCASSKTPEGEQKIKMLAVKIGTTEARIQQIANNQFVQPSPSAREAPPAPPNAAPVVPPTQANHRIDDYA